jgi:hypothetical protein
LHHIDQGSCPAQAALPKRLRAQPAARATHLLPGKLIVPLQ